MALHIRDAETDRLVRQLAEVRGIALTEAIRIAVGNELRRVPLRERVRPLQDRLEAAGKTGLKADKAFYDNLNGSP
jgi:antitoxin VapB